MASAAVLRGIRLQRWVVHTVAVEASNPFTSLNDSTAGMGYTLGLFARPTNAAVISIVLVVTCCVFNGVLPALKEVCWNGLDLRTPVGLSVPFLDGQTFRLRTFLW